MKNIKECQWDVEVTENGSYAWFTANSQDCSYISELAGDTIELVKHDKQTALSTAKQSWIDFAELNGVTNYTFINEVSL